MRRLRVVVSGMVAGDPGQGGATWALLQYVLGLERLGHEVRVIEPIRPERTRSPALVRYFSDSTGALGLRGRAALVCGTSTIGASYEELREYCRTADLLLNVSGMLADPDLFLPITTRVYLDLDPAFVQRWNADGIDMGFEGHTHFVTVGLSIGTADCSIPTCGRLWLRTLPPVVLDRWPVETRPPADQSLTTIANWRSYGSVEHQGRLLGQKAHALRELWDLPITTGHPFRLALRIHESETKDLELLRAGGWELVDPDAAAGTPAKYRSFVRMSMAEFGLAKSGYVVSRSGWFSDRSACYLASGRPVVAHATGFERTLPVGEGLFSFTDGDDVSRAIDALRRDPPRQAKAARALAEEWFDSDRVLGRLLSLVGVT